MRILIFLVLAQAQYLFGHELVWKNSEHELINKQLSTRPIFLKRKIRKNIKIERRDLGFAQSPFYKTQNSYYRYYKQAVKCYKLVVDKNSNTFSKLKRCRNFRKNITIEVAGVEAKRVMKGPKEKQIFQMSNQEYKFTYLGHTNSWSEIVDMDLGDLDEYPTESLLLNVIGKTNLTLNEKSFSLNRELSATREKFSFLSAQTKRQNQEIRIFLQSELDFVFEDDAGNYYFYRRFQPKPFSLGFLNVSAKYIDYLEQVETLFYDYKGSKRCFRNHWFKSSEYDCDTLLFGMKPFSSDKHSLIKINSQKSTFEVIKL